MDYLNNLKKCSRWYDRRLRDYLLRLYKNNCWNFSKMAWKYLKFVKVPLTFLHLIKADDAYCRPCSQLITSSIIQSKSPSTHTHCTHSMENYPSIVIRPLCACSSIKVHWPTSQLIEKSTFRQLSIIKMVAM